MKIYDLARILLCCNIMLRS